MGEQWRSSGGEWGGGEWRWSGGAMEGSGRGVEEEGRSGAAGLEGPSKYPSSGDVWMVTTFLFQARTQITTHASHSPTAEAGL